MNKIKDHQFIIKSLLAMIAICGIFYIVMPLVGIEKDNDTGTLFKDNIFYTTNFDGKKLVIKERVSGTQITLDGNNVSDRIIRTSDNQTTFLFLSNDYPMYKNKNELVEPTDWFMMNDNKMCTYLLNKDDKYYFSDNEFFIYFSSEEIYEKNENDIDMNLIYTCIKRWEESLDPINFDEVSDQSVISHFSLSYPVVYYNYDDGYFEHSNLYVKYFNYEGEKLVNVNFYDASIGSEIEKNYYVSNEDLNDLIDLTKTMFSN